MSETELNIKRRMSELECAAGGVSSQRMFTQMRNLVNQALEARTNQPRPAIPEGYAGATVWIGDKRVTQVVTEEEIKYERETGMAITHATQACLDLLAAAQQQERGE